MRDVIVISITSGTLVELPEPFDCTVDALVEVLPLLSDPDGAVREWRVPESQTVLSAITKTRGPSAVNAISMYGESDVGEIRVHCCRAKGRIANTMIKDIQALSELQVAPALLQRSPPRPWALIHSPESQLPLVSSIVTAWKKLK